MSLFSWIRELFGISKDIREVRKVSLEIERLEAQAAEREMFFTQAKIKEVAKHDPKARKLEKLETIEGGDRGVTTYPREALRGRRVPAMLWVAIILFLLAWAFAVFLK